MPDATSSIRAATVASLLGALVLALPGAGAVAGSDPAANSPALTTPFQLSQDRPVEDRLPQPEDRYALASGCYAIEAPGTGFVGAGNSVAADLASAEGFHFRATRLGEYLLATDEGENTEFEGAWWDDRDYLAVQGLTDLAATTLVGLDDQPSPAAEWRVIATGEDGDAKAAPGETQTYRLQSATSDLALTAGATGLVATDGDGGAFAFHLLDDPARCAVWPEIDVNVDGRPAAPGGGPAGEVQGFFEAHVHGMAFEFLGGEARCGRPWHPYGVEFALVDCEDHGPGGMTAPLETFLSGATSHDTVGWPTFGYWPNPGSLTHEQFYYRWVERAYLGGLRLMTNLLVDNSALCEIYPVKRNSCNEMDGVRLQAQRVFEMQDYIDAQSGGPGEGWYRVVTSPAEARMAVNAGRLGVVLGIEVSTLFDCGETLDTPHCTADDIDDRLDEVFAMGVRQMELLNKFDSGLAGVTGDGGTTGAVVNVGNRWVTGHWWDMQACEEDAGSHVHEHDKTQYNAQDDIPDGGRPEFDVLAGAIIDLFGPTQGFVAPAYPAGPHCNTRGLTDLGRHLIGRMVEKGMVFDPDHMSASAIRESLDLIQDEIIPAEHEAAAAEGRAPIQPAVISSHSWANDAAYHRIYELDGQVAPRTASADRFVDYWAERRAWAAEYAPTQHFFGIGYGADTNGFGGQPGAHGAAVRVDYDGGFEAPIGGVTIHRQVSGLRQYDINEEGVNHYGLFADWYEAVRLAADVEYASLGGGAAVMRDLLNGSESYLRLWERAVYGGAPCVDDQSFLQREDIHAAIGLDFEGFLRAAGQPVDRDGAAYLYCVAGADGQAEVVSVNFDTAGFAAAATETDIPAGAFAPQAAEHVHALGASEDALPATGGGLATAALLLIGLTGLVTQATGRRR